MRTINKPSQTATSIINDDRFILKVYDHIARGQSQIHFNLSNPKRKTKAKRHVDHKKTNRNAIITALILTLIIVTSATTGLIIILSSASNIPTPDRSIAQTSAIESKKGKFFLKIYDYVSRGQEEIHDSLSKI